MPHSLLGRVPLLGSLILMLVLALAGCAAGPVASGPDGSPGSAETRIDPGNPGRSGVYPKKAKPLPSATVKTDRSKAATKTASWRTDTTITATGRDGTSYTLAVPKGALLSDVDITITPMSGLSGVPVTRGVGGVQLEPEGLVFQQPVTLTVTPKGGVPAAPSGGRVGVLAASGNGGEPHGHGFAAVSSTSVTVFLTHFSFYYVGTFSPGDLEAILLSVPSASDGQLAQDLFGGEDPSEVFTAWYNDVVDPALDAAEANLDLAPDASRVALSWLRQAALLGVEFADGLQQAVQQRLLNLQVRIYERASERCRTSHDLRQVGTMIGAARALALLGGEHTGDVATLVNACLRIEFDLEESITVSTDYVDEAIHKQASGGWSMKAEQFVIEDWFVEEPDLVTPWVAAPDFHRKQSISCPSGKGRTDDQFTLTDSPEPKWHVNLRFDFNPNNDPSHDAASVVHGTLQLTPVESSTKETAEVSQVGCNGDRTGFTMHRGVWVSRFVQFREGESDTPTSITIPIEAGPGDPVVAERHGTTTLPDVDDPKGGTMTETLDVKLTHNPK